MLAVILTLSRHRDNQVRGDAYTPLTHVFGTRNCRETAVLGSSQRFKRG